MASGALRRRGPGCAAWATDAARPMGTGNGLHGAVVTDYCRVGVVITAHGALPISGSEQCSNGPNWLDEELGHGSGSTFVVGGLQRDGRAPSGGAEFGPNRRMNGGKVVCR